MPSLVWLKNGILIDDSYSIRSITDHVPGHSSASSFNVTSPSSSSSSSSGSNPVVVNELLLSSLQRSDLFSIFSCRAWNSNLTTSVTSSVTLDMNLKPVDVKIVSFKRTLTAGEKTEVICQSRGSRPPATLSWFLNNEPVTHFVSQSFSEDGNLTTSILNFMPSPSADGQVLKCQSESAITGQVFMTDEDDVDNDETVEDREVGVGSSSDENGDQVGSNRSLVDPVIDGSRLSKGDDELMKRKKVMKSKKGSTSSSSGSSSKIGNQSVPSKSTLTDSSSSSSSSPGSFSTILTTSKSKSTPVSSSVNNSNAGASSPKLPNSKSYSSHGKQQKSSKKAMTHHPHQISDEWQLQIFCKFHPFLLPPPFLLPSEGKKTPRFLLHSLTTPSSTLIQSTAHYLHVHHADTEAREFPESVFCITV